MSRFRIALLFVVFGLLGCSYPVAFLLGVETQEVSTSQDNAGFCETFEGQSLSAFWHVEYGQEAFAARNGELYVEVDQPEGESFKFSYIPLGQFQEVSASFQLRSSTSNVPGGVGISAVLNDGRDLSIDLGPGPDGAGFELGICPYGKICSGDYDEYFHLGGPIVVGIEIPVRILLTEETAQFYVSDTLVHEELNSDNFITGVSLYAYGDPGAKFIMTADDFCIVSG